jgi:phage tail-like protein
MPRPPATEFAPLLYALLPGVYRDRDEGALRRFLEIAAEPLADLERSIAQLHEDLYVATAREELLPLVGALVGIDVDPTGPARAQRVEVEEALAAYRRKGLGGPLERLAERLTGWRVTVVDFSSRIALVPFLSDLHTPTPAALPAATLDLRPAPELRRLGRSDDAATRTADVRRPRRPTEPVGHHLYDNLGFFFTPARRFLFQHPNELPPGSQSGRFSFDGRFLEPGDVDGFTLQLQDGIDGSPLTREKLAREPDAFCGTTRGFSILVDRLDVCHPDFRPRMTIHAADLSDPAQPRTPDGAPLALEANGVAVDPELGRFVVDLGALGVTSEHLRVDYALTPAEPIRDVPALPVDPAVPECRTVEHAAQGPWRDGLDGTALDAKLRLGAAVGDLHGRDRGWRIRRNGVDVSSAAGGAVPAEVRDLGDVGAAVTVGTVAVDLRRGRVKFAAGLLAADDAVTLDFHVEDRARTHELLRGSARRLERFVPAGVVPVVVDTRRPRVDPTHLPVA